MRWPFAGKNRVAVDLPGKSASSTRFAFRLFQQLAQEPEAGNVFFSPASVMLCLWLLRDGATGETREAMTKVLEIASLEPEVAQSLIVALKSALQIGGDGLRLETTNSLWCNNRWTPREEYVGAVKRDYDAEVSTLDFGEAEAVARINAWVSAKTAGKITNILGSLDPRSSLVAINTIYFKGSWASPFHREFTRDEPFHTWEGRTIKVPLMSRHGSHSYYEESKFQVVRLPYRAPRVGMYVFLPAKRSSLQEFQRNLDSAAWDKWLGRMREMPGHIKLPRFQLTHQATLNRALSKLGMEIAFDPQRARFDRINPPPPETWIERVLQRAFVEVNEEGTEAAAATASMVAVSSPKKSKPPRTFEMIVDRPFFFAIHDHLTNTILFMGSVGCCPPHS